VLRQRTTKTIARMYNDRIRVEEKFYLRLLLLHVKGPSSFENLKTVNGVQCNTFKEAEMQIGLLDTDEEWDWTLEESANFQMPKQMRQTFAYILIFSSPSRPLELWEKYKQNLCLDFMRTESEQNSFNNGLHDINNVLEQHGKVNILINKMENIKKTFLQNLEDLKSINL
jgi:hypothetical protein